MPAYNKLVRDKIPAIIEASDKRCRTRVLEREEYIHELDIKLDEEIQEYKQAACDKEALEELADILEVMHALAAIHGADWDELEKIRVEKREARGGFDNRVYLIDVHET